MGPGCKTVRRVKTDGVDLVVGVWKGGRIGTFRDLRGGKTDFTTIIHGTAQNDNQFGILKINDRRVLKLAGKGH